MIYFFPRSASTHPNLQTNDMYGKLEKWTECLQAKLHPSKLVKTVFHLVFQHCDSLILWTLILQKLFAISFPYKHCNFSLLCLTGKMALNSWKPWSTSFSGSSLFTSRKYSGYGWSRGYARQPKPHWGWVLDLILSLLSGEVNVSLLHGHYFKNFEREASYLSEILPDQCFILTSQTH